MDSFKVDDVVIYDAYYGKISKSLGGWYYIDIVYQNQIATMRCLESEICKVKNLPEHIFVAWLEHGII